MLAILLTLLSRTLFALPHYILIKLSHKIKVIDDNVLLFNMMVHAHIICVTISIYLYLRSLEGLLPILFLFCNACLCVYQMLEAISGITSIAFHIPGFCPLHVSKILKRETNWGDGTEFRSKLLFTANNEERFILEDFTTQLFSLVFFLVSFPSCPVVLKTAVITLSIVGWFTSLGLHTNNAISAKRINTLYLHAIQNTKGQLNTVDGKRIKLDPEDAAYIMNFSDTELMFCSKIVAQYMVHTCDCEIRHTAEKFTSLSRKIEKVKDKVLTFSLGIPWGTTIAQKVIVGAFLHMTVIMFVHTIFAVTHDRVATYMNEMFSFLEPFFVSISFGYYLGLSLVGFFLVFISLILTLLTPKKTLLISSLIMGVVVLWGVW